MKSKSIYDGMKGVEILATEDEVPLTDNVPSVYEQIRRSYENIFRKSPKPIITSYPADQNNTETK